MKEIARQFGGTLVAVIVAIAMLSLIVNTVQYGSDTGFLAKAGNLVKQEKALPANTADQVFYNYWREK